MNVNLWFVFWQTKSFCYTFLEMSQMGGILCCVPQQIHIYLGYTYQNNMCTQCKPREAETDLLQSYLCYMSNLLQQMEVKWASSTRLLSLLCRNSFRKIFRSLFAWVFSHLNSGCRPDWSECVNCSERNPERIGLSLRKPKKVGGIVKWVSCCVCIYYKHGK